MIAVRTIAHGRAELFELWVRHTKSLKGVKPVAAVSCMDTEKVCIEHDIPYVRMPNRPLARKCNLSLKLAEHLNPDAVITCGSDDFISQGYIDYCNENLEEYNLIHSLDIYYYNVPTNEYAYSRGYENHRRGEPLSVGRCYRADLLEKMNWQTMPNITDSSIDRNVKMYIEQHRHHFNQHIFRQRDSPGMIVDVKTGNNITPFKWRPNYEPVDDTRFREIGVWNEIANLKPIED